jgi:hypothetical protein
MGSEGTTLSIPHEAGRTTRGGEAIWHAEHEIAVRRVRVANDGRPDRDSNAGPTA